MFAMKGFDETCFAKSDLQRAVEGTEGRRGGIEGRRSDSVSYRCQRAVEVTEGRKGGKGRRAVEGTEGRRRDRGS